jgi:hypothetical protein
MEIYKIEKTNVYNIFNMSFFNKHYLIKSEL